MNPEWVTWPEGWAAGKGRAKTNVQLSCSGLGGRAEERAGADDEDGRSGSDDEDDVDGGESCDKLPGLIQKARVLASPFHSHTRRNQITNWLQLLCKQVQDCGNRFERASQKGEVFLNITFLGAVALLVTLGTVPTVHAGSPLFLKQLVHSLDDALQRFIHIHPNFLLPGQRQTEVSRIEFTALDYLWKNCRID